MMGTFRDEEFNAEGAKSLSMAFDWTALRGMRFGWPKGVFRSANQSTGGSLWGCDS